jgi:hypothetical protein
LAGESADSEYERIRTGRRERVRRHWALLVGLAAASVAGTAVAMQVLVGVWWIGAVVGLLPVANLLLPSQREVAWRKGAQGERVVARAIDKLASTRALHDRRIPGSRANIDHILIAPTGVWTIDAKNYTGKLKTRRRGRQLWINGWDRSKLLEQAHRQTVVVAEVLAAAGLATVPVRPALCFVGVEWPLLFTPRRAGDVQLLSPRRLSALTVGTPALSASEIELVAVALDRELLPAAKTSSPQLASPSRSSRSASSPPREAGSAPASAGEVTVKPWKRYGKDRLYVNAPDGTTLGYLDLQANNVVPTEERYRAIVREAVARYYARTDKTGPPPG